MGCGAVKGQLGENVRPVADVESVERRRPPQGRGSPALALSAPRRSVHP